MPLPDVVAAPARFRAESRWNSLSACIATLAIVVVSLGVPVAIAIVLMRVGGSPESGSDGMDVSSLSAWGPLLLSQVLMSAGAIWLAGWYRSPRAAVLSLEPPHPSVRNIVIWFLAVGTVSLVYTAALYAWRPEIVRNDIASFMPMIRSNAWPAYALIIAVGAPLSEELLFRGFLQSALAKSPIGYIGASVLTTVSWTLLHIQYSIFGLAEIFFVGLFLCWVLWRSGSLWATIAIHGLFNGIQFVGARFGLFPWT